MALVLFLNVAYHVSQFMGQQPLSTCRPWLILVLTKDNIVAYGECFSIHHVCRLGGLRIGMNAYMAEATAEACFHKCEV